MGERGCTVSELTELLQSLQHTEALQLLNPTIKIVVEPESQAVFSGQMVKLSCWATGYPLLYYQWFKEKKMVPNGNSPELIFSQVTAEDAGLYICRVNSDFSYEFSQWAQLDVCDSQRDSDVQGSYLELPEKKIHIYLHPQSQNLTVGQMLILQCEAMGNPPPQYQWCKEEFPLPNGEEKAYVVSCVDIEHQGTYWCRVYNNQENEESRKVKVTIEELNDLARPDLEQPTERQFGK
uniref:Ig-like domain-containing protein n=1 Tax=Laticauda laticaudata TaxID=8630 RepID=A0A8C5SHU7_LATLA